MISWIVLTFMFSNIYAGSKWDHRFLNGSGTINFGAIIPVFGENYSINYGTGILALEGLKFGIDAYNELFPYALYGYKLALHDVHIPDPHDPYAALGVLNYVAKSAGRDSNVTFVIGPELTNDALSVATLTGMLSNVNGAGIAAYSYGSSSSVYDFLSLDCKNTYKSSVPSDTFRFQVIVDLFTKFKWSYIAIMTSWGPNGNMDAIEFKKQIESLDMCVPVEVPLRDNPKLTEVEAGIKDIKDIPRHPVKVIVLFTQNSDSRKVLIALKNLKLEGRFILVFVYGSANYLEVVRGYEEVAVGSLTIDLQAVEIFHFERRFLELNPTNTEAEYFHLFWEDLFQCHLANSNVLKHVRPPKRKLYKTNCTGKEKMEKYKGYYPNSLAARLQDTVDYVVGGLRYFLMSQCGCIKPGCKKTTCAFVPDKRKYPRFYEDVRNIMCKFTVNHRYNSYKLYKNRAFHLIPITFEVWNFQPFDGQLQNVKVARWKMEYGTKDPVLPIEALRNAKKIELTMTGRRIYWKNHSGLGPPTATCREECKASFYQQYLTVKGFEQENKDCCWKCIPCPKKNIVLNNRCVPCHYTETTNLTINRCVPLPEHILTIDLHSHGLVIGLVVLCLFGGVFVLFIVIIFVLFNKNHVVRSSGRDLSYSILCGLMLLFSCPILFLMKPTKSVCALRDIIPCLSFLLCYAALGLKVIRIYRIFISAETRVTRPVFVTTWSQLFILGGISVVQFLIAGSWFVKNPPGTEKVVSENELFVTYHCKGVRNYAKYVANLLPSIIAQISCTLLAYKTRNFPKNYNEAKYIANTLFVSFLYWCIFLPTFSFRSSSDTYFAEHAISVQCIMIGYTTLFGLFAHKLVLILQGKPLEEHHDSLKARARSLSSRSSRKESGSADVVQESQFCT